MAYESDLTRFMREYLKEHPEEAQSQKNGRLIWWDKEPAGRTEPSPPRHSPKAGGAEYTFEPLSEADKAQS